MIVPCDTKKLWWNERPERVTGYVEAWVRNGVAITGRTESMKLSKRDSVATRLSVSADVMNVCRTVGRVISMSESPR